jgi:hypothetical protein
MTLALLKENWAQANQALLQAEFARLKRRLGVEVGSRGASVGEARKLLANAPPAIDRLCSICNLTQFERDLLLLCAGVEMDSALAGRAPITFGLALGALGEPHWSALTPARPLRGLQLLRMDAAAALTAAPLKIDERVLHFVAGTNMLDARLTALVRAPEEPALVGEEHRSAATRAAAAFATRQAPVILLCGNDDAGQEDVAQLAATELELRLLSIRAGDLPAIGPELDHTLLLLERETLLLPAAVLLQCDPGTLTPAARLLAERLPGPLFLATRKAVLLERAALRFDIDRSGPSEQRRLWQAALGPAAKHFGSALDEVAVQFSLSARSIAATGAALADGCGLATSAALASARAVTTADGDAATGRGLARDAAPARQALWDACREIARPRLEDLAQRIVPTCGWQDLILPAAQLQTLRRLVAHVRHRMQVHEGWGFAGKGRRGLGVNALFAGESGTGKTLAAEVLAAELRLDLYRIDLSAVVSKYIGDTEKNLRQVFDAAEQGGVLLLFDEADALFGKRAEVKDSHDRYANIEVGYLLQRMEAYQGLALLTTNLKSSLDRAFQRRLRFVVTFPFPDAAQREAIWRQIFPAGTPCSGLDHARLAQLNVAGGNIRNIALSAAFLAAEAGASVSMAQVLEAARMEAQKIERPLSSAEIRGWV